MLSSEGSTSSASRDHPFVSERREVEPEMGTGSQPENESLSSNATATSAESMSSNHEDPLTKHHQTPHKVSHRKRLSNDEEDGVVAKKIGRE